MKESTISLKPYLDRISAYCSELSKKELTDIIISLAKEVPSSERMSFLKQIESYIHRYKKTVSTETHSVDEILDEVEELREDIVNRISSIEDGTYWDEYWDYSNGLWQNDSYYDDDQPEYVTEEQIEYLESLFDVADEIFLKGDLEGAKKLYRSLLDLVDFIESDAIVFPDNINLKEARARYCRCVYETSDLETRLEKFIMAMKPDLPFEFYQDRYLERYPLMQDVIDAKQEEMKDLDSFWPMWKNALSRWTKTARVSILYLEAIHHLQGIDGVVQKAREWGEKQPQGYFYWLKILEKEKEFRGMLDVCKEALEIFDENMIKRRIANIMISAAKELGDNKHILMGKRERFFSDPGDSSLLDFIAEATVQGKKNTEIDRAIRFCNECSTNQAHLKPIRVKLHLMAGDLESAFVEAKSERCMGWSSNNVAGIVFGAILSSIVDHSDRASTIKALFQNYSEVYQYFGINSSVNQSANTSLYEYIVDGLKAKKETKSLAVKYFSWAVEIGAKRIDHIVSNKYRGAYERAAKVLGSLAEAYILSGRKGEAEKIINTFCRIKYSRYSAFKREVKKVTNDSSILRCLSFV